MSPFLSLFYPFHLLSIFCLIFFRQKFRRVHNFNVKPFISFFLTISLSFHLSFTSSVSLSLQFNIQYIYFRETSTCNTNNNITWNHNSRTLPFSTISAFLVSVSFPSAQNPYHSYIKFTHIIANKQWETWSIVVSVRVDFRLGRTRSRRRRRVQRAGPA